MSIHGQSLRSIDECYADPYQHPRVTCHLSVFFQSDRHGRKVAYRWSGQQMRAFRMRLTDAEVFVAQGLATDIGHHPMKAR